MSMNPSGLYVFVSLLLHDSNGNFEISNQQPMRREKTAVFGWNDFSAE